MSYYFIGMINFSKEQSVDSRSSKEYEEYITLAKPILETYQGTYLVRTESIWNIQKVLESSYVEERVDKKINNINGSQHSENQAAYRKDMLDKKSNDKKEEWVPDKVIIVKFPDLEHLQACFKSQEYQAIMGKRINNVISKGFIVGGLDNED